MKTRDRGADRAGPPGERSVSMPGNRLVTTKVAAERTGWAYSLFEVEVGAGGGEAPHIEHREDEYLYVIEGRFGLVVEGETSEAGPGTHVYVARGALHAYECVGDGTGKLCSWSTRRAAHRRASWRPASRRPALRTARAETTRGSPCSRRSTASRYAGRRKT